MKKGILITLVFFLPYSCFSQATESFQAFFTQFNQSKSFQIERIVFPLPIKHGEYATKSGEVETFYMEKKEWSFSDLSKQNDLKRFFTIKSPSPSIRVLLHEVEDTGIFVQYFFKKQKGKWFLYQIHDDST